MTITRRSMMTSLAALAVAPLDALTGAGDIDISVDNHLDMTRTDLARSTKPSMFLYVYNDRCFHWNGERFVSMEEHYFGSTNHDHH